LHRRKACLQRRDASRLKTEASGLCLLETMTESEFADRLSAVARGVAAPGRAQTESLIASVVHAGGTSESALIAMLTNRGLDPDLRADVCWLVPRLGIAADDALEDLMSSDPSEQVRAEAAAALGLSLDDGVVDVLLAAVETDPSAQVQHAALHALGVHSAPRSASGLIALLQQRAAAEDLRADAAEALAHVHDDRVVPALISALDDPSPSVRYSAAYALGEQGDPTAREPLQRLAEHDQADTPWGTVAAQARRSVDALADRGP
jgi:HEAT repeats